MLSRICRKHRHANSWRYKTKWFSTDGWGWTVLTNCYLRFSNFWKLQKIGEKEYLKKIRKAFELSKTRYMRKNSFMCICVQNLNSISWKLTNLWHFEGRKWLFFTLFPGNSAISRFSKCCPIWAFHKVFYGHFSRSWRKTDLKHVSRVPNIKFLIWPLDLVTLNSLDLGYTHRKLRIILISVPDTIHVVALTYFHFIRP